MDEDMAFLRQANRGSERMDDAAVERVREMAQRYRWADAQGAEQPLLNDNELENLTIRAGTLTGAEREVINHHIVATIQMLEKLPWPKHLARVPEYAGGHHERMDGKGYPKGLKRDEMSLQARMMGIADIFEALTAADRPYKAPMKLSQALKIMQNFKDNGHIDPDLYGVFLAQQVPQKYAQKFLAEAQLDC
jgi:HD-GYP domain-containing protein (c-di-GMP phosphodiesterase class II)